jgi:hypothetical protein
MAGKSGRTAPRTRTNSSSAPKLPEAQTFPYTKYEGSELWRRIEQAVEDLARNGDLQEMTARKYIVGYLCQALAPALKSS